MSICEMYGKWGWGWGVVAPKRCHMINKTRYIKNTFGPVIKYDSRIAAAVGETLGTVRLWSIERVGPDSNRMEKCSLTSVRCAFLRGFESAERICHSRVCSWQKCVGPDSNQRQTRFARLPGFEPALPVVVLTSFEQNMRGTGFEPADPYGTAPSTLRRWPGLATHAHCVLLQ